MADFCGYLWCLRVRARCYVAAPLKTLLYMGGTSSTTCGTNYELEDNAGCTYSGTRELACNTCSMILTTNNIKKT